MVSRIAVMGGGAWGTVFAMVLADAGNDVVLWTRDEAVAADIRAHRRNRAYHRGIVLPDAITATTDAAQALADASSVALAVPSQAVRELLASWKPHLDPAALLVSLMKGIELGTAERMSEVIAEAAGAEPERVAVVSGPNLAREIALRQPTATTVACVDEAHALAVQRQCTTSYFRPYWTTDVVGTEIGGAVKNVIALANGMAVGLGLGENTQASLMTRGLAEMARLGVAMGADPMTFQGLAGVGDLVATCQSPLSRNRTFGVHLGQGLSLEEASRRMNETCEGVKSCKPILDLARRHGVGMPITEQVVRVVHEGAPPSELAGAFMARPTERETH